MSCDFPATRVIIWHDGLKKTQVRSLFMPFRLQETAAALEQKIRARRLMDIPGAWSGELIFPSYDGLSLRNIPHSAAALLNAPLKNSVPLDNSVWGGEFPSKPVNRVVIFLMDGMGYRHLN